MISISLGRTFPVSTWPFFSHKMPRFLLSILFRTEDTEFLHFPSPYFFQSLFFAAAAQDYTCMFGVEICGGHRNRSTTTVIITMTSTLIATNKSDIMKLMTILNTSSTNSTTKREEKSTGKTMIQVRLG